MSAAVDGSET